MDAEYTKALIYCRVSSEKQVKEGNGLDSQEHRCREYAQSLGLEVEHVFRDEGISGGLFDRPAIQALLKHMDKHWQSKYVVIFDDLKRFARDVEVHLRLKSELMGREAKLKCLNYNFDDSAEGEFVETIFAAQNQLERKQNRRQVCQKMKARIERGYWCFCPPTGYEFRKDKQHGKLLMAVQPIADILAEGLTAFAEDRLLEQSDFLQFLLSKNLHGLMDKDRKRITYEYVKGILTQPLYAGIIAYPEWGIPKRRGHHRAIISEEIFAKIQHKLKRPERKPRETDNLEFPLRRVISCACCNKKLTGSVSRGKRKYYAHYTCNNKECTANPKNISVGIIEKDYVQLLEKIKLEPELLVMIKEIVMRMWDQKMKDFTTSQEATRVEMKAIEEQISAYVEIIPTARLSLRGRYEAKAEELELRLGSLKAELTNKKDPNIEEILDLALKLLGTPAETWQNVLKDLKTMVHNMIFAVNPTYSLKDGFGTPLLTLPFSIKQHTADINNDLVEPSGFEPLTPTMSM